MNHPKPDWTALEPLADHSVSRLVFEYHCLRRRLIELHSTEPNNLVIIDAVMRKLDETRSAVRAAQLPLGTSAALRAPAPAYP